MFRYEPNKDGDGYVINCYKGDAVINPNPKPETYINFGKFIQSQPHDPRRGARLFESTEELIEFCKGQGFVLKATELLQENSSHIGTPKRAFEVAGTTGDTFQIDELRTISQRGQRSNLFIPSDLNASSLASMSDDKADIRRISNLSINRAFVYFDVSDFSKHTSVEQLLVINSLANIVKAEWAWNLHNTLKLARANLEAQICIGDGYIYVFSSQISAIVFAAHLAGLVEALEAMGKLPVEFHFRMGVDAGEVRCFFDPGRKDWNYIGDGINDAQRILSSIEKTTDDVLYISWRTRKELIANPDNQFFTHLHTNTTNKGRRADKHGIMRRVYEVNFSNVFNAYRTQFVNFLAANS